MEQVSNRQKFKIIQMSGAGQGGIGDIMHHQQIKQLISKLVKIPIKDYVSPIWFKQDEKLQKLNMQLHVNAIMKNDQFILEQMITQQKYQMLIIDLLITAAWKKNVLPIIKNDVTQFNSLKIYLAIYHEAVVLNMLEVMLYHYTAVHESKQLLIEIIDYCYKKVTPQIARAVQKRIKAKNAKQLTAEQKKQAKIDKITKRTPIQQLDGQIEEIDFSLFIMCVSIIKYVTDYVKDLQIGVIHHIVIECNIFSLLVPLIEEKPWLRTNDDGERQIFQNNKWNVIPKSQYGRLPKAEGQIWLTLYNLFGNPDCMKKYELNDERKNMLLRLRKFMNQVLLDQIPALAAMLRSLQHLSMTNVPANLSSNPFIVEQVPMVLAQIQKNINWKELATEHTNKLKQSLDQSEREHMQRLAELYSNNNVEGLVEGFKCGKCGKQAFKRCSKCKGIWYCTRECQVADWPNHKVKCAQKAKQLKEAEQNAKEIKLTPTVPQKTLVDELD